MAPAAPEPVEAPASVAAAPAAASPQKEELSPPTDNFVSISAEEGHEESSMAPNIVQHDQEVRLYPMFRTHS